MSFQTALHCVNFEGVFACLSLAVFSTFTFISTFKGTFVPLCFPALVQEWPLSSEPDFSCFTEVLKEPEIHSDCHDYPVVHSQMLGRPAGSTISGY